MSLQEDIISKIDNPSEATRQWAEEITANYPYFVLPTALALKHCSDLSDEERAEMMARVALYAGDKDTLARLVDSDAEKWLNFYPREEEKAPISTNDAIDTFIDIYGKPDPKEEEILTKLIFNPTPDYAQLLSEEEERSAPDPSVAGVDSQDAMINAFILKSREQQGHFPSTTEKEEEPVLVIDDTPVNAPEENDGSLLSESLAKIYIKQRRYSKAYEIISNLSLNFPEKSIYFADQLRFLRKLMINQKHINNNN